MKTILVSAYAVNPYKGSEDGMGWNFIYQIAKHNKVIAITRENNKEHIKRYMLEHPDERYQNIEFLHFDLPYWMRFWKKRNRGAMLYFYLWQKAIPAFAKKQQLSFDIVHNLNFHNDWTPSFLWTLNKPFVWGPIGHHPAIPYQYLKPFGIKHFFKDRFTWLMKKIFWNFSSSLKSTISHANHVICMNSSVEGVLRLKKGSFSILPSVATQDFGYQMAEKANFTLITAGRLVPLKGFDLSILAFAKFVKTLSAAEKGKCKLIIVGSGPQKQLFQNMTDENGIRNNVLFIDWMERTDLLKLYQESSVFLFPSHEGAGMVVAEALSFALPVICLDNSGPGEFITSDCGIAVPNGSYQNTIDNLSEAIKTLFFDKEKLQEMSLKARERFEGHFNWNERAEKLNAIYQTL